MRFSPTLRLFGRPKLKPGRYRPIATLLTIPQYQRERDRLSWWRAIEVGNSGMVDEEGGPNQGVARKWAGDVKASTPSTMW